MTILYVNPTTGKNTAMGSPTDPLKTLTQALSQAKTGTTIQLAPGTYDTANGEVFPLSIPAEVIILGNETTKGKEILITGSGTYNSPTFKAQNITLFLETGAQLRGVTVTNPGKQGTGIWIESTSPIITNNTVKNCSREAIFVTGQGKPIIQDNQFLSNTASGIFFVRQAKGELRRNLCENTGYGIAISDQAAPLLSENRLVSNRVGIHLSRQSRPVLRRNLIEDNTQAGIVVTGEAQPEFGHPQDPARNIVRNNREFDLRNSSSFPLVSAGNLLNPAKVDGIVEFVSTQVEASTPGPSEFKDISGHWAEGFISALVERGLIRGFPDGTFKPEANLTRAEYAAILAKTFDLPRQLGAKTGGFNDVPSDFWAFAAIQKAAAMKFIAGFPDGTFRPQNQLTRVQALVSLMSGLGLSGGNANVLSVYSDRAQIPSYATNAIATATERRMVINYPYPQNLNPLQDISRAEIAALVYQALVATNQAKAIPSPYIVNADSYHPSFADIQGHWANDFIRRLASLDLVNGFVDGTFKPNHPINRAQYAALIVKVFNPSFLRPSTQFTDIPADFWALSVIQHAYQGGYLSGFPDQTFHPEQNLRRIHLIVSLANGLGLPAAPESLLEIYEDANLIPAYAQSAVAAATQAKIIVNAPIPTQLQPMGEATRADAAVMVYQALVYQHKAIAIDSPYIIQV